MNSDLDRALMQWGEDTDVEPRLDRLRRFVAYLEREDRCKDEREALSRSVAWIERRLDAVGEDERLHARLNEAEARARELLVQPWIERDAKRQKGTRAPRGSKMPILDGMLDDALALDPKATNDALWHNVSADADACDFEDKCVYRDHETLIERHGDREHSISRAGFDKRATSARKRRQ